MNDPPNAAPSGWDEFVRCCMLFNESVSPGMSALRFPVRHRGGPPSRAEMLFTTAFELALESTLQADGWNRIAPTIDEARQKIAFVLPSESFSGVSSPGYEGKNIHPRRVVECFARCYASAVAMVDAWPPHPALLKLQFARCHSAWIADSLEYQAVLPVSGVHPSVFDPVILSESISIGFTNDLLGPFARQQIESFPSTPLMFPPMTSLIQKFRAFKTDRFEDHRIRCAGQFQRMIRAFRLATGKSVGGEMMYLLPSEDCQQTFPLAIFLDQMPECQSRKRWNATHGFSEADFELVRETNSLLSRPSSEQAAIAIERFSWSFGKHTAEDSVIDLAIALESLLCRMNDKAQLSFKFRLFGAAILAGTPECEGAEKLLRQLYDARSSVVHGGKRLAELRGRKELLEGMDPKEFIEKCSEATRRVIVAFLKEAEAGRSPEAYLRNLQDSMIQNAKAGVA